MKFFSLPTMLLALPVLPALAETNSLAPLNWTANQNHQNNAGDLPVDSHEMIALCAPRPTFISYGASSGNGAEGTWVDQHGSFMAAVAAGPVFKLLGKKDLGTTGNYLTDPMPAVNEAVIGGELAWRQHDGGHTDAPNWPTFLKWAGKYISVAPSK